MKNRLFAFIILLTFSQCQAQKMVVPTSKKTIERPKLVVGIIVDQMRYDYLIRFYDKYGTNGFKKLMQDGYHCENAHFNYIPTYTAVGHASVFSGTTPDMHGIIANYWYDKYAKETIYCVDDKNYETVGSDKGGQKSPYRLQTTTFGDQLKLAQNNKGKTIGISIKDRSAIFPAGHSANAAYWYKGKDEGKFITSSFYMDNLPDWAVAFNNLNKAKTYTDTAWTTLYDINSYTESMADDNPYEGLFKGEEKPVFPHDLPNLKAENKNLDIIKYTPFGNSIVTDFAKAAIIGEDLGGTNHTDLLTISYSSTDYIGHRYGTDAKEIQDTYLRLDKDIAGLITFLNDKVGENKYTIFLTADHAAVPTPSYLKKLKINAHYFDVKQFKESVKQFAQERFGSEKIIEKFSNYQLFLDHEEIKKLKLDGHVVAKSIKNEIIHYPNVYKAVTAETLQNTHFTHGILHYLQNGYNQKLSGDVLIVPTPATINYSKTGTTHGSGYSYDTHVPLLFYGFGINKGKTKKYIPITYIAPTISSLLQIEFPNGNTGNIIDEVLK